MLENNCLHESQLQKRRLGYTTALEHFQPLETNVSSLVHKADAAEWIGSCAMSQGFPSTISPLP